MKCYLCISTYQYYPLFSSFCLHCCFFNRIFLLITIHCFTAPSTTYTSPLFSWGLFHLYFHKNEKVRSFTYFCIGFRSETLPIRATDCIWSDCPSLSHSVRGLPSFTVNPDFAITSVLSHFYCYCSSCIQWPKAIREFLLSFLILERT